MKLKSLILASALVASFGAAQAQTAASAVSAASLVPMAIVLSVGVAGGSTIQDASGLALSVGAELVVETVTSTAKGVSYGLRRVSDGAKVSIEVLSKVAGKVSLAAGTAVTVVAISGGIVLSAAGEAIAFIPNQVGKSLMHNRVLR